MPCAKLCITHDIIKKIKRNINDKTCEYCGHIIDIPITTIYTSVPYRPKGEIVATVSIHWNKLKKIKIQKIYSIIKKYNYYMGCDYICNDSKDVLYQHILNEVDLFIEYINIVMKWENIDDEYQIYFNKKSVWKTF